MGDQHIKGVELFKTFAPVFQYPTIRLMMILLLVLGLATLQAYVTAAFLNEYLDE